MCKKFKSDGSITDRSNAEGIIYLLSQYPTDTSIYHIYHWEAIQEEKKLVCYNPHSKLSDEVKEYDLNVIKNWKIRALITRSFCDSLSPYSEVNKFINLIKNQSLITIFDTQDFSHLDYGLAKSAYEDFYIPLVNFLDEK